MKNLNKKFKLLNNIHGVIKIKKTLILLLAFSLQQIFAQEQTLLSNTSVYSNGGFGAPVLKYTTINNTGSLLIGGRGGWIINNSLILGGGIYGLVDDISIDEKTGDVLQQDEENTRLMYGGFEIEYIFYPMDLFHVSVYTLLGMGNISNKNDFYQTDGDYHMGEMNRFFVAEPAINLEVNVTTFFILLLGRLIGILLVQNIKQ